MYYSLGKKLLLLTTLILAFTTIGSCSSSSDEELKPSKRFVKVATNGSNVNHTAKLDLLEKLLQHLPADMMDYPDLYHQALTRSSKQFVKQQHRALNDLLTIENTRNTIQEQQENHKILQQTLDINASQIAQQEQLLKTHNIKEDGESGLLRDIHATIERQKKIIADLNNNPLSDDQKNRLRTAQSLLAKASEQLDIISIPLSQRKFERIMLTQDLHKLEKEINDYHKTTVEEIDQQRQQHEKLIDSLMDIRSKSVYSLEGTLKTTKGYIFPKYLPKAILTKMLSSSGTCLIYMSQISDQQMLWTYMVQNLELPDPYFMTPVPNLLHAYIEQTQELKNLFEQRCQEDAACLTVLCQRLEHYNRKQVEQTNKLEFDMSEFIQPERRLWSYLTAQDTDRAFNLVEAPIRVKLQELLSEHGADISDYYIYKFASQPLGILGHTLESLKRGNFYSWQSDQALLVKFNNKLKSNTNPSREIMLAFYRLLGRITNKIALELSLEILQTYKHSPIKQSINQFMPFLIED